VSALPQLIDRAGIQAELGVTSAAAEKIMQRLDKVRIEGLRKTFVRRGDLERLVRDSTRAA
jgi:hypothetical protein